MGASPAASAAVCEPAARCPAAPRPAFSATMGVLRATRRATWAKRRGLPKSSRYRSTTRVPASRSHQASRSFEDTSALFPRLTKAERPIPRSAQYESAAIPRPPLCEAKAMRPDAGPSGAKVASNGAAPPVTAIPRQLGPIIRIPLVRTMCTSSACRAAPSWPASEKPADRTTSARAPRAAASRATAGTPAAGTATTTRSTRSGRAAREGWVARPATVPGARFTAYNAPGKPLPTSAEKTAPPGERGFREAPTTAIARGRKRGSSDAAAAVANRAALASSRASSDWSGMRTRQSPGAFISRTSPPRPRKTVRIFQLSCRTDAHRASRPSATARARRCSMRPVPSPRPCQASATATANSASGAPVLRW